METGNQLDGVGANAMVQRACPAPGHSWLMFLTGTDPNVARRRFQEKFGVPPDRIETWPSGLFVGPIPPPAQ